MKDIKTYINNIDILTINETLSDDYKKLMKSLDNILNNYNDDDYNNSEIRKKDLERAKEVLTNLDKDTYSYFTDKNTGIFKNNSAAFKALMNKLEHNHLKRKFIKLYSQKDKFPTLTELESENNIYTLFNKKFDNESFISKEDLKALIQDILSISTKDNSNKGIGKGEIFLNTFIKNAKKTNKADITIDDINIEVKAHISSKKDDSGGKDGGRLKGNNDKIKSPKDIIQFLKKNFDNESVDEILNNNYIGGYTKINKICKEIEKLGISIKTIFNIFAKAYYYQFFENEYNFELPESVKDYINTLKDKVNKDNIGKILINEVHAIFAIIAYSTEWDKLFVINITNGKYYILNNSKEELKNKGEQISFKNINKLAEICNTNFMFKQGPANSPGCNQQDYVSAIYIKD